MALPFQLRLAPDAPDMLDLPWHLPLEEWAAQCPRVVEVQRGLSRHLVIFVSYDDAVFALKRLPLRTAQREYRLLKWLETQALPAVHPVGMAVPESDPTDEREAVLLTRHLEFSLPYRHLFVQRNPSQYRACLLDAMASLLVQLHLKGFFWGDCSLSNVLFRRDAEQLQAYLVDTETAEVAETLSEQMRLYDIEIARENLTGDLLDLDAEGVLSDQLDPYGFGDELMGRYLGLWRELTTDIYIATDETYRIESQIRRLNELGFSVGEVLLEQAEQGNRLKLKVSVADRQYHHHRLHSLVGLTAGEEQARALLNDISQFHALLNRDAPRRLPLSVVAYRWLEESYRAAVRTLGELTEVSEDPVQMYCELLVHKWYRSEQAGKDVGLLAAAESYAAHLRDDAQGKSSPPGGLSPSGGPSS